MDHPAVAKVSDAGSTPQGAPYFVMEYVAGVSITAYCDNHRLSTANGSKSSCTYAKGSSTLTRKPSFTATTAT
jgi:hypothetical protein